MIHFSLPFFENRSPKFFTPSFLLPFFLLILGALIGFGGYYYTEPFLYFVGTIVILISGIFTFENLLSGHVSISPHNWRSLLNFRRPSLSLPLGKKKPNLAINWLWYSISFGLGLIFLTGIFALLTVFGLPAIDQPQVATVTLLAFVRFAQDYWILVSLLTAITFVVLQIILFLLNRKTYTFKQAGLNALFSAVSLVVLTLIATHLATATMLGLRYWELRQSASLIASDPQSVGLYSGRDTITTSLRDAKKPVTITHNTSVIDTTKLLMSTARIPGGAFYRQTLPQLLPAEQLPEVHLPTSPLLLSEDYLLVREIVKDDFGTLSPALARLWVRSYFDPRTIKEDLPEFALVDRQEYLRLRDVQIDEKVSEIQSEISAIDGRISGLYGQRNQLIYQFWNGEISIDEAVRRYDSILGQIGSLQRQRADLVAVKSIVEGQKKITPYELGIFNPDKSIKVVLDDTDINKLYDYLATLVHEQLHYASYISKERRLPQFFEEGLTEYFSRKVVAKYTGVETDSGYPIINRVIAQIAKDIPEDRLAEIYFTKNEDLLKQTLNEKYGENFYEDSEYHFLVMPLMGFEDSLKYANDIMIEIGGNEIKAEEITLE